MAIIGVSNLGTISHQQNSEMLLDEAKGEIGSSVSAFYAHVSVCVSIKYSCSSATQVQFASLVTLKVFHYLQDMS